MYLAAKEGRFHHLSYSLTHSNSIGELEEGKEDQAKATAWRQNQKIVTLAFE